MPAKTLLLLVVLSSLVWPAVADEPIGQRPYEMDWANRREDVRPALVDFEDLNGWTTECVDADASFVRSRQQQLWGQYVGRLAYRGRGPKATVTLKPPRPIPVPGPLNCVNLWVYGNNWAWAPEPTTPPVEISVLLRGRSGPVVPVSLGRVRWKEWWLMHERLSPERLASLGSDVVFEGIRISGGRNEDQRLLYFDNLAIYQEQLPRLEFAPRPARGVAPFAGQSAGTNTGPGKLALDERGGRAALAGTRGVEPAERL